MPSTISKRFEIAFVVPKADQLQIFVKSALRHAKYGVDDADYSEIAPGMKEALTNVQYKLVQGEFERSTRFIMNKPWK